ncbi:MAG: hypothetical protein R6V28_14555 [Nitriliruptoraceae bacterium]
MSPIDLYPGNEFLPTPLAEHGPCAMGKIAAHLGVEQPTTTVMASAGRWHLRRY